MNYSYLRSSKIDASSFPSHMHNGYEILYFLDGDADYMIEGTVYRLERHDLLLIKPRTYHNLLPVSQAPYERCVVNFSAEEIGKECDGYAMNLPDVFSVRDDEYIRGFFKSWIEIGKTADKTDIHDYIAGNIKNLLMVLRCLHHGKYDSGGEKNTFLEKLLEYIDGNITRNLTLEGIAKEFYISPSWLSHMFSEKMGVSIMKYVIRKRMLFAQKLIREGVSPTEAAYMCGADNYSTFFRQYKKNIGISPREERA